MKLADVQSCHAAVNFSVTVHQHAIFSRGRFNAVIGVGALGVKIKGEHQAGAFEYEGQISRVFI